MATKPGGERSLKKFKQIKKVWFDFISLSAIEGLGKLFIETLVRPGECLGP